MSEARRRGIRFELDLEPEPDGWLEDSATTIDFFERELYPYARREARRIGRRSGKAMSETIRNHIGVCFDTSHFSCRFENLIEVWRLIQSYSIRIGKLQLSSALELPAGVVAEVLAPFDEPQYLHQATLESPRRHFPDLGAALVACRGAGGAFDSRLRCHYHMPLFAAAHGKLNTSRDETAALLQWLAARQQLPEQIEIETYTRSLLAPELQGTTAGFIAAELEWVEQQIEADREESKRCQKL